jgi:hypothetical protein
MLVLIDGNDPEDLLIEPQRLLWIAHRQRNVSEAVSPDRAGRHAAMVILLLTKSTKDAKGTKAFFDRLIDGATFVASSD